MRKKAISMLLTLSLVTGGVSVMSGGRVYAADSLAALSYAFSSLTADTETSGTTTDYTLKKTKYGSKKDGYRFTSGTATLYASIDGSSKRKLEWSTDLYSYGSSKTRQPVMTAGKKNPWKSGTTPYFEIQFATTGYESVSFSAYVGATKKGPKNYQLAYAIGSGSFSTISGTAFSLSDNKKMEKVSATLPASAADQSVVRVRIQVSSLVAINGNSLTGDSTSGEAAINGISITGNKKAASVASSSSSNASASSSSASTGTYKAKKVKLKKTKLTLKKGKKYQLKVNVAASPNTKANKALVRKSLKWSSSNKKIATVSQKGVVKAKKKGKVTITVKASAKVKAKCKVTVK